MLRNVLFFCAIRLEGRSPVRITEKPALTIIGRGWQIMLSWVFSAHQQIFSQLACLGRAILN